MHVRNLVCTWKLAHCLLTASIHLAVDRQHQAMHTIMMPCTHKRTRSFCTVHSTLESVALGSEPCSHRSSTTPGDLVCAAKCRAVHPCRTQNTRILSYSLCFLSVYTARICHVLSFNRTVKHTDYHMAIWSSVGSENDVWSYVLRNWH